MQDHTHKKHFRGAIQSVQSGENSHSTRSIVHTRRGVFFFFTAEPLHHIKGSKIFFPSGRERGAKREERA